MYLKNKFLVKLFFCIFALLATQELQAMPYIYSRHVRGITPVTSQLLGTRTYNAEGQVISEGDSAGRLTSYTYYTTSQSPGQSIGQLSTTTDRDGNVIHHTYTDHGQLKKSWAVTKAGVTMDTLTLQYDNGDDQLTGSTYQQNQSTPVSITTLQYNLASELSSKKYSDGKAQSYTYNLNGSVKSFTNVLNQTMNYTYTPMHQLSTVVFNSGTTTYTYDEFGRKTNETRPNGVQTNWTYDDYNGVKTITSLLPSSRVSNTSFSSSRASEASRGISSPPHNPAPQTLNQLTYTYYSDGNIATETPSAGTTYTYQYNNLNQLQNFACTGAQCPKDSHGNTISNNVYSYTLNNGIATITTKNTKGETNTATYHYYTSTHYPDRLENITNSNSAFGQSGTYLYDKNGNVTTNANGNAITYDALNQMLTIKKSSGTLVSSYGYNGSGKVDQETPTGQTPINEYYGGNGSAVTTRIQGSSATTYAIGTDRIAQYYYADSTKPATSTQYYLYDQRGSVTNVLGSSSNIGYVYSPFGYLSKTGSTKKKSTTTNLNNNTFGYIGQSLDPTTGLMMMGGYRAYNPAVGDFLKEDSYSPFQGADTFNGYDYGAGNPVLFIDPTGHLAWGWWVLIVAAAVTVVVGGGALVAAGLGGGAAAGAAAAGDAAGAAVADASGEAAVGAAAGSEAGGNTGTFLTARSAFNSLLRTSIRSITGSIAREEAFASVAPDAEAASSGAIAGGEGAEDEIPLELDEANQGKYRMLSNRLLNDPTGLKNEISTRIDSQDLGWKGKLLKGPLKRGELSRVDKYSRMGSSQEYINSLLRSARNNASSFGLGSDATDNDIFSAICNRFFG